MPDEKIGVAGVAVLYHPDEKVEENILSYLPHLSLLVVVNNSPAIHPTLMDFLNRSEKILYLEDGVNRGIAAALNLGAQKAIESGCSRLLTMDQDGRFEPGSLERLIQYSENHPQTGIVSPLHVLAGKIDSDRPENEMVNAPYVMMSGNILNLKAYRAIGPFLEKLFIDYVDYEYCLRLRKYGYGICVLSGAKLFHPLGRIESRHFLGLVFHPTNHSPERRYYAARNRLFVMISYPAFAIPDLWAWLKELAKLLAFEKEKRVKLEYMGKGILDFLRNRYGFFNVEWSKIPNKSLPNFESEKSDSTRPRL